MVHKIQTNEMNSKENFIIQIFPDADSVNILWKKNLTCKIYFQNERSSKELDVPCSQKDFVTLRLVTKNYGPPEKIVIRQRHESTWLLNSITGSSFSWFKNWKFFLLVSSPRYGSKFFPACRWFGDGRNTRTVSEGVLYKISIKTGSGFNNGTSRSIGLRICGEEDEETNQWQLTNSESNKKPFMK